MRVCELRALLTELCFELTAAHGQGKGRKPSVWKPPMGTLYQVPHGKVFLLVSSSPAFIDEEMEATRSKNTHGKEEHLRFKPQKSRFQSPNPYLTENKTG